MTKDVAGQYDIVRLQNARRFSSEASARTVSNRLNQSSDEKPLIFSSVWLGRDTFAVQVDHGISETLGYLG